MPRSNDGVMTRTNGGFSGDKVWADQAASADKTISSQRHDTHDQDMATEITDSLSRSGKGGMLATLDMQNNSLDNIGGGSADNMTVTPSGDGATARTLGSVKKEFVHVFDRIPAAQHAAILAGTSTYEANSDLAQAFQDGISKGVPVVFPGPGSKIRLGNGSVTMMNVGQSGLTVFFNTCRIEKAGSDTSFVTQDSSDGSAKTALTSNLSAGDNVVTLPSSLVSTLSAGDIVAFKSNLVVIDPGTTNGRARELRRVMSISGNDVTLDFQIYNNYNTSDSATAERYSAIMCSDLSVYDPVFVTANGTETARGMRFDNVDRLRIYNYKCIRGGTLQVMDCYDVIAEDIYIERPPAGENVGTGYGFTWTGSSVGLQLRNLSGSDTRHLFTTNPRIFTTTEPDIPYGEPQHGFLGGGMGTASKNVFLQINDTHPQGFEIDISNVKSVRSAGSGSGCFKPRARRVRYHNCYAVGGARNWDLTSQSEDCEIYGGTGYDASSVALAGGCKESAPSKVYGLRLYNGALRGISCNINGALFQDIFLQNFANNFLRDQSTTGIIVKGARLVKGSSSTAEPLNGFTKSGGQYSGIDFVGWDKFDNLSAQVTGGLFTDMFWNGVAMSRTRFDYQADANVLSCFNEATHGNASATSAVDFDLPPAIVGLKFPFYRDATQTITVTPDGTETIGSGTAGQSLSLDADGTWVICECVKAGRWETNLINGTISFV